MTVGTEVRVTNINGDKGHRMVGRLGVVTAVNQGPDHDFLKVRLDDDNLSVHRKWGILVFEREVEAL